MIEKKKIAHNLTLKREIMAELNERRGENSAEELLTMLLGDGINEHTHWEFRLYKYREDKRTLVNRINMIWIYPLFILTIPFQWIITGSVGVSRNSFVGRAIDKLARLD